jgi:hypothetical protein
VNTNADAGASWGVAVTSTNRARIVFAIVAAIAAATSAAADQACGHCKVRVGAPLAKDAKPIPFSALDHSRFDALLHRFVDCEGLVSYRAWKDDHGAMCELRSYLESFCAVDWSSGEKEPQHRMAALINAYNGLALFGILREYPTVSIQVHNREGACYRIFDDLELCIGGEYLSLNSIEHGVLRPLGDFRIHFAIVCAARGCPKLRNEAYTADRLDHQLWCNGRDFFASDKRWGIHRIMKNAHVSPILKWFRDDFGGCDCEILRRIHSYLPCDDQRWLARHGCVKLRFLGYNWALNDRHPPPFQRAAAIPYGWFAEVAPTMKPLFNLIRPEKQSTPSQPPSPLIQPEAPATPDPKPGDDAPPPRKLKPKEDEKTSACCDCDAPMWIIATEPCTTRRVVR